MTRWLPLILILGCATTPVEPPGPPQMAVVGRVRHLCGANIKAARQLPVQLLEERTLLAETTTSSTGQFRMELEMSEEEGLFTLAVDEAEIKIRGSTRLRYRVEVTLPCDDEDLQEGPARVLSEVWPEEK